MTRRIDAASARETRLCESCGQTFEPARTDALFCSAACRQRAYRRRGGVTDNPGAALRIIPVGGSVTDNSGLVDETGARVTDKVDPPLRLIEARNLRLGAGVEGQPKMPFKKGQSGNPGGRPKIAEEINALARQHCPEAIERLVHIMRNGTPDTAQPRRQGRAPNAP